MARLIFNCYTQTRRHGRFIRISLFNDIKSKTNIAQISFVYSAVRQIGRVINELHLRDGQFKIISQF